MQTLLVFFCSIHWNIYKEYPEFECANCVLYHHSCVLLHSCWTTTNEPIPHCFLSVCQFLFFKASTLFVCFSLTFIHHCICAVSTSRGGDGGGGGGGSSSDGDRKQITDAVADATVSTDCYRFNSSQRNFPKRNSREKRKKKLLNWLFYGVKLPIQAIWYSNWVNVVNMCISLFIFMLSVSAAEHCHRKTTHTHTVHCSPIPLMNAPFCTCSALSCS